MSVKVSVYIATSLDGFIARNDGGLDWLNEANASVPNVLTHIPCSALQAWWDVIKPRAMNGSSIELRFEELRRLGKTDAEIQVARHEHEVYWDDAVALVQSFFGGVRPRVHAMVRRSLEIVPLLLG